MSKFANLQFWVDTGDRAVASFAQGLIGTAGLDGIGIVSVDWLGVLSLAGSYALLSVLTSIAFRGGAPTDTEGV